MSLMADTMAAQLRMPHGPVAPMVALSLNRRNRGLIEKTIAALEVRPHHRVLDVGFGGALSLELLAARAGHVCGVDPSAEMVTRARRLLSRMINQGRVSVEQGYAESLPCADAQFDRVLTCQTVYFWDDLRAGLSEMRRVLVPGGRLVVGMMPKSLQERFGFVERGYIVLSHDDLMLHLEEAGFAKVRPWPSLAAGPRWIVVAERP